MNRIVFDQLISKEPDTFAFITIPEKVPEKVPERGQSYCSYNDVVSMSLVQRHNYKVTVTTSPLQHKFYNVTFTMT